MKTVSATDAEQRFAAIIDAAQREPVRVRRQNRDVAVILPAEEYDRIRGANMENSTAFVSASLSEVSKPLIHRHHV